LQKIHEDEQKYLFDDLNWVFYLLFCYMVFFRKIVFFYYLSPTYRFKWSYKISTHGECTVTPICVPFSAQPIASQYWRGRSHNILERTHFFLNTLYFKTSKSSNGDAAGIQGGRYQNEGIASIWFKPQFGIFCPGIT